MMRTKLLLFSLILLCLATPARAADINAASCSASDVQTAINSASEGDRVLVPAGACTWSINVRIENKGITLQGAGIDQTVITDTIAGNAALTIIAGTAIAVVRATGFTFDAAGVTKSGSNGIINIAGAGVDKFRVDNIRLLNLRSRGISIFMEGFELAGVIDNCIIEAPFTASVQGISIFGDGPEESTPFSRPLELGSNKFIFIEDCTFNYTSVNDGALDAFSGARYVFRHNTVNGTTIGHHGADSGETVGFTASRCMKTSSTLLVLALRACSFTAPARASSLTTSGLAITVEPNWTTSVVAVALLLGGNAMEPRRGTRTRPVRRDMLASTKLGIFSLRIKEGQTT